MGKACEREIAVDELRILSTCCAATRERLCSQNLNEFVDPGKGCAGALTVFLKALFNIGCRPGVGFVSLTQQQLQPPGSSHRGPVCNRLE